MEKRNRALSWMIMVCLALMALPTAANSPEPFSTWAKTYGGAQFDSASLLKDNGDGTYFIWGMTKSTSGNGQDLLLMKVDGTGSIVWQKTYGTAGDDYGAIATTSDGGFSAYFSGILSGAPLTLIKLDGSGGISWQKTYGTGTDTFDAVQVLSGGGFLLSGSTFVAYPPPVQGIARLMKLDSSGNIVWQKEYSSPTQYLVSIISIPLADGTILADVFAMDASYHQHSVLMKLDASGGIVWQKSYVPPTGAAYGFFRPDADGAALFEGSYNPAPPPGTGTADILIAKLDNAGNITWQKTYGGSKDDSGYILPITGGYVLSGGTKSYSAAGNQNALMAKLDASGNVVWAKTYGGAQDDSLSAMADSTGGYLLQGGTLSYATSLAANPDTWAVKVNNSGDIQWQRAYGGANEDSAYLYRLAGGNLLITGDTNSVGAGDRDIWIWQLDSQGQLGFSCPLLHDTNTNAVPITLGTGAGPLVAGSTDVVVTVSTYASETGSMASHSIAFSPQDACSGTPSLSASASANVASGAAPLAVNFTGSASGGTGSYSYLWDFGDGSPTATTQNPSHSFAFAGTYTVALTVTDAAQATATDNHLEIAVTGGTCTLDCSAMVPAAGTTGEAIVFSSTYSAPNCTGSPIFAWTFGDQTAPSMTQNVSHTYAAAGTYNWNLTATINGLACIHSGSITISTPGAKPGDCNGDGTVSIGEVQKAINMFLGTQATGCGVDCNADGTVSIGEVQKVINGFLGLAAVC